MASFMANLFPGGKQDKTEVRPSTPTRNSFTTPGSTPQGSPSKKTIPPGANELPDAVENLKLGSGHPLDSPVKLSRPQSVFLPLSPGKGNINNVDDTPTSVDDSIIHKGLNSSGTPLRKQGQENTPPASARNPAGEPAFQPSHAAVSRHELYHLKDRPTTPAKKFNTSRGLTPEELEILQKPNVKRLVNVTQLCKSTQDSPETTER